MHNNATDQSGYADLLPAPRTTRAAPGAAPRAALTEATVLDAGPGTGATARWLRDTVGAATGLALPPGTERDPAGPAVRLRVDPAVPGPEGYRLAVTEDRGHGRVTLTGSDPAGVFWGAQTLRQLLGPAAFRRAPLDPGRAWSLPHGAVEDRPRFGWRGMMLDVARHFLPKDGVLRYLDLLAAHKLNVLHLHLTDDQGWRIEIRRHPELTRTGAWRPRTKAGHRASPRWDERPHGGYYTQDDIREIVAYAAARHITVVPEIDIPGHSQAAIAAYPHLGNADVVDTAALGVWDTWGVNPNILAPSDETLRFYEGVFEEVLDLFPGPFVHVGGDEAPKDQWRASPAAQARIRELGLDTPGAPGGTPEDALQSWFVRHFDSWLGARGRRLIGWDEILEGGLAPGAAVSSWRGYGGGIAAAEAGHDVVMCPEQHVYLDHRQAAGPDEPVPIGYVRTLEDVYRFDPLPPALDAAHAHRVLGAQANVWTEAMEDQGRVDYQVFPRLCAFAEVVWSDLPAPAGRDLPGFTARLAAHTRRLDALGVAHRPADGPLPWQRRPGLLGRPIEGSPPSV